MKNEKITYSVNLSFEEIKLPPFEQILVVGKNSPTGKIGISKSFEMLSPNGFQIFEDINHEHIEAVFINKHILKKMCAEKIFQILAEKVFPYVSDSELIRVDFKVKLNYSQIEIE